MGEIDMNYYLIAVGIIAIAIEIIIGAASGFDLLLIGSIFALSGGVGIVVHSFSVALILIILMSGAYIAVGRTYIRSKLSIQTTNRQLNTLVGKQGYVTKPITKQNPGQVKIEGETWRAVSCHELKVREDIVVDSVTGVTLTVSKI